MEHQIQTFTIWEAISTAWKFTKKYWIVLIILLIISITPDIIGKIIEFGMQQIPNATTLVTDSMTGVTSREFVGIYAIIDSLILIVLGIVGAWLGLGLIKANFQILEDKKPAIKIITSASCMQLMRLIGSTILVVCASILWVIALILPGIWIAIRLSLFQYYIAEGYWAIDAIKASWYATKGNFWKLLGIGFVYVGITLLWVLALVIGLLWAIPTVTLAQAFVYKKLKANTPSHIKPINENKLG